MAQEWKRQEFIIEGAFPFFVVRINDIYIYLKCVRDNDRTLFKKLIQVLEGLGQNKQSPNFVYVHNIVITFVYNII